MKDKEPRVTSPPPVLADKKDKAPTPKTIIKPAVFVPKIETIEKVAAFETKKGQEAAVKSLADGPSAPPTPKSVKKVPRAATPPPVKKATPAPSSPPVKKVVQEPKVIFYGVLTAVRVSQGCWVPLDNHFYVLNISSLSFLQLFNFCNVGHI